jgi:hypothetical protein
MLAIIWKWFNIFEIYTQKKKVSSTIYIQTCLCLLPLGSALNQNGDSITKDVLYSAIREVIVQCEFRKQFQRQTFFGGNSSSRRKGVFARGEVQDGQKCQRNFEPN